MTPPDHRAAADRRFTGPAVDFLSIGPYRRSHERLLSWLAARLLPVSMREEVVMVCTKPL